MLCYGGGQKFCGKISDVKLISYRSINNYLIVTGRRVSEAIAGNVVSIYVIVV